jgi:hypothetical protein
MGNSLMSRIDGMGSRIDNLEKSIGDLVDQSGLSDADPSLSSSAAAAAAASASSASTNVMMKKKQQLVEKNLA